MSNNAIVILLIIVVLIIGGFLLYEKYAGEDMGAGETGTMTESGGATSADQSTTVNGEEESVKEFTVAAKPFSLTPNAITVNKGDRVRIVLKNESGNHNFVIDEFNVRTPVIGGGTEATAEFTAGQAGIYEFYCGVGTHRAMGMVGKLIVK